MNEQMSEYSAFKDYFWQMQDGHGSKTVGLQ